MVAVKFPRSIRQAGVRLECKIEDKDILHLSSAKMGVREEAFSIKSRLPVRQDKREVGALSGQWKQSQKKRAENRGSDGLLLHRCVPLLLDLDLSGLSALCLNTDQWSGSTKAWG
jgi:hypothetical protein